jgi:hypothetical protein
VQNSVTVPYNIFKWLKKSTAAHVNTMTRRSVDGPHHVQQAIHLHLHLQAAGQPTSSFQNPISDLKVRVILD